MSENVTSGADLSFTFQQETTPALSFSLGPGQASLGMDVTQVNDILMSLLERAIAHQFDENADYKRFDYVILEHRLWQFIDDHDAGEWAPADVRQIPLAEDVKLLFTYLIREYMLVGGSDWRTTTSALITDGGGYFPGSALKGYKHIPAPYQPGQQYCITTPCENPDAYIRIIYDRVGSGGGSAVLYDELSGANGLNGATFVTREGSQSGKIEDFTIVLIGFTAEEIAQTCVYSRFPKNEMIAADFSEEAAYSAGDYAILRGLLYRFIANKAAGAFDTDKAESLCVTDVLRELSVTDGKLISALGITPYTPSTSANFQYDTWYWEIGSNYVAMAPNPNNGSLGFSELGDEVVHLPTSSDSTWQVTTFAGFISNQINGKLNATLKGAANGLAELDSNGLIPAAQLPSYVDDVVEGYLYNGVFYAESAHTTALTGMSGKIYVDLTSGSRKVYRWSGSVYAEIPIGLALGESSADAYRGDRGAAAYAHAVTNKGSAFASGLYKITTNAEGHVTAATAATEADIMALHTGHTAKNSGLYLVTIDAKGHVSAASLAGNQDINGLILDDLETGDPDDYTWSITRIKAENANEAFKVDTGAISSLPKTITDARITAEYIVIEEMLDPQIDIGWVTTAGKLVLYGTLPSGTTLESKQLKLVRCHGLQADPVTITLTQQNSTSENGHYLKAAASNLIPGVQYSWRLMKAVSGGNDVQVYGIAATPTTPTYTMWFQQVPRSLEDGETYYCTIKTTAGNETPATSGTVEFEAATLSS